MSPVRRFLLLGGLALLAACAPLPERGGEPARRTPDAARPDAADLPPSPRAADVVMFSLGLIDTGYRFGGRNPEAGLDCSGMVRYVYSQAASMKLAGSAADIARQGRAVGTDELRPGDLVFFNTLRRPRSHVGIYLGGGRFVHAPSSRGKVRIDSLHQDWYASRFEEARTYLD